jgi:hypothetical protein
MLTSNTGLVVSAEIASINFLWGLLSSRSLRYQNDVQPSEKILEISGIDIRFQLTADAGLMNHSDAYLILHRFTGERAFTRRGLMRMVFVVGALAN